MKEIDRLLAKACDAEPSLPEYDADDQYASPFACESAMPGNYFKNAGLTDTFRKAKIKGNFADTLVQVAFDMINDVDDVSWAKDERDQNRQVIGTMRMLLRRWARGGFGEALAMMEYGYVPDTKALQVVAKKTGTFYDDSQDMDENGHIDFVSPGGDMVQVKTTVNKPTYSETRDYDTLVWVKPESYELVEVEG